MTVHWVVNRSLRRNCARVAGAVAGPNEPRLGIALDADGFSVLPGVVSEERTALLRSALYSLGAGYGLRNLLTASPEVEQLAETLRPLAASILGDDAFPVRGLFFDKIPGANWKVDWHQDLSIAVAERIPAPGFSGWSVKQGVTHVQPPTTVLEKMLALRLHLDDCGPGNGPLRVLRGSHRHGRLTEEQIEYWKRTGREVTCLVPAGGALAMRPLLLHASSPAQIPRHRRVIHLEYAAEPLPGGLRWFESSKISQGPSGYRQNYESPPAREAPFLPRH